MELLTLIRTESSDDGTFGSVIVKGVTFQTGELPWRNDDSDVSCEKEGVFQCSESYSKHLSPLFGGINLYLVEGDAARKGVRIHPANWMGDSTKFQKDGITKMKCQLQGCIALGLSVGILEGQKALINSRTAVNRFMALLNHQPFQLTITSNYPIPYAPNIVQVPQA